MLMNEPAVAEALRRAHAALLKDLTRLEEASAAASQEGIVHFRAQLEVTRRHIAEHFRFEEENGYLEAVRKRQPHLERSIEQLAEEHKALVQGLEALVARANQETSNSADLRGEVRSWVGQLRRHEERENDLVLDAFNLDVGAED